MLIRTITGFFLLGYTNAAIQVSLVSTGGVTIPYNVDPNGGCFSLNGGSLAQFNDNLQKMIIPSGYECTIWENFNCNGKHTNSIKGSPRIADICASSSWNWSKAASSFKCCKSTPTGSWCAGNVPTCT